jgi:DNA replication protein DnaC
VNTPNQLDVKAALGTKPAARDNEWREADQAKARTEMLQSIARITPPRYKNATIESADLTAAVDAIGKGTADGILLAGPTGVGKTHAAYAALTMLANRVKWLRAPSVEAVSVPDMLARCRPGAEPFRNRDPFGDGHETAPVDFYANKGLLLLDDLGAEKPSEWTGEVLYRIIDSRYNYERPTIVVSNLPPAELAKQIGDRLASRLTQMCRTVVIKGEDRRRTR